MIKWDDVKKNIKSLIDEEIKECEADAERLVQKYCKFEVK
jgi:hypothetical protein